VHHRHACKKSVLITVRAFMVDLHFHLSKMARRQADRQAGRQAEQGGGGTIYVVKFDSYAAPRQLSTLIVNIFYSKQASYVVYSGNLLHRYMRLNQNNRSPRLGNSASQEIMRGIPLHMHLCHVHAHLPRCLTDMQYRQTARGSTEH
jgi:hypothetical protein